MPSRLVRALVAGKRAKLERDAPEHADSPRNPGSPRRSGSSKRFLRKGLRLEPGPRHAGRSSMRRRSAVAVLGRRPASAQNCNGRPRTRPETRDRHRPKVLIWCSRTKSALLGVGPPVAVLRACRSTAQNGNGRARLQRRLSRARTRLEGTKSAQFCALAGRRPRTATGEEHQISTFRRVPWRIGVFPERVATVQAVAFQIGQLHRQVQAPIAIFKKKLARGIWARPPHPLIAKQSLGRRTPASAFVISKTKKHPHAGRSFVCWARVRACQTCSQCVEDLPHAQKRC